MIDERLFSSVNWAERCKYWTFSFRIICLALHPGTTDTGTSILSTYHVTDYVSFIWTDMFFSFFVTWLPRINGISMLIATAKSPYVRDASKSREASIGRDTNNSSNSRKSIPAAKKTEHWQHQDQQQQQRWHSLASSRDATNRRNARAGKWKNFLESAASQRLSTAVTLMIAHNSRMSLAGMRASAERQKFRSCLGNSQKKQKRD